jgi:hypothetical protein
VKKRKGRETVIIVRVSHAEKAEMQRQARGWKRTLSEVIRAMFGLANKGETS